MAYSGQVLDHYENPRNVGKMGQGRFQCRNWSSRCSSLRRCTTTSNQGGK
jgi:NifU-like protein involved in Fe-S cluster formation